MSFLRTIGPASIDVWISSPVRSRNPVLMKATRAEAARMHSTRLTEVRRSSSMMPIFTVCRGSPSTSSTRPKTASANATSSGPCIFGLTTYTDPARRCSGTPARRSCVAHRTVTSASSKPSGTSCPSGSSTAGVVIRCPTLRTSSSARPGRVISEPSGAMYARSGASRRVDDRPSLATSAVSAPVSRPSQLRYASALSAPSTAATESSQSTIAVTADSSTTSATPAGSSRPTA